ncbi:MAG: hypothetical protein IPO37_01105 [Saprospiraceae bacterium]|nr:hypothetical protein [Saprospiraceae bacterium]
MDFDKGSVTRLIQKFFISVSTGDRYWINSVTYESRINRCSGLYNPSMMKHSSGK